MDNPGKPNQCANIPEPNGPECFLLLDDSQSSLYQFFLCYGQILFREGERRDGVQQKIDKLPVIFRAHLFGDENTARFQNMSDC